VTSTESLDRFGAGPLSRGAARVYTLLVVQGLLLVTTLPGLVPLLLLAPRSGNLPLAALCLVPVGPAVCAALYTLHHQRPDLTELHPGTLFRRGYRAGLAGSLRIWVPVLLWLTLLGVNLTNLAAAGLSPAWVLPLLLVGAGVTLVGANALTITALFAFRTRDVLRLALHFLVRTPGVAVGNLLLLAAAAGVTVVASEAVPALLGALFLLAFLRTGAPMIDRIEKEFTG
jgi:hypothetical protein